MPPVIALLSDFGLSDHYVGTVKGVVLGICGDAVLVDVTHEIAPQDVLGGALELAASYRYFPPATVFLAVVDPGVGSVRRGIAAEAAGWRFVGPDNGLFSLVFAESPPTLLVELQNVRYARPTISRTFEGRDRFAPAAAWLARGVPMGELGPPVERFERLHVPSPLVSAERLAGDVVRIDRFGNLVTNIDRQAFDAFAGGHARLAVRIGRHPEVRLVGTYGEAAPHEPCALFGSTEHLEIAVNGGSASAALGLGRGAPVHVTRRA
jgi:S-adenosylmethionine hydrolase